MFEPAPMDLEIQLMDVGFVMQLSFLVFIFKPL